MRALSLFSGIGGIDLACEWAGIETVAFCEKEPFCQKVLKKHWPHITIYDDVCTLTKERLDADGIGTIDLIHGGYPCQPFSLAGKRGGAEDDRHLWPEVARILDDIRPRWFVGENVAGHVSLGLDDVLSDLESLGYSTQAFVIPACAVYASHRRDRVFIVAYRDSERHDGSGRKTASIANRNRKENGLSMQDGQDVADSCGAGRKERHSAAVTGGSGYGPRSGNPFGADWATQPGMGGGVDELPTKMDGGGLNPLDTLKGIIDSYPQPALMGQPQYDWEPPRVATGVKNRAARLKALGNAVVPQQIYPILAAIKQIDDMLKAV